MDFAFLKNKGRLIIKSLTNDAAIKGMHVQVCKEICYNCQNTGQIGVVV
jgi:hypothetical protein